MPPIIGETRRSGDRGRHERLRPRSSRCSAGSAQRRVRILARRPVEDGFDGSGAEAVARVPRGARGLLRALRVGVRPDGADARDAVAHRRRLSAGRRDHRRRSTAQTVYSVSSSQLHAWPEVYFEGIGWIAFEPTVGLGVPTTFSPAATLADNPGTAQDVDAAARRASALGARSAGRPGQPATRARREPTASSTTVNPLPALGIVLAVLAAARDPGARRRACARRQLSAPPARATRRRVDGGAGCRDRSRHPRSGERAPARARSSPGPRARRTAGGDDAARGRDRARELLPRWPRLRPQTGRWRMPRPPSAPGCSRELPSVTARAGLLVPRSLIIRPGSVYAGAGARTVAR